MNELSLGDENVALYPIHKVFQLQRMSEVSLCMMLRVAVVFRCTLLFLGVEYNNSVKFYKNFLCTRQIS